MKLNMKLTQQQTLKQVLTPKMIQRMKAYQMPIDAFTDWIETQDNVMLDIQSSEDRYVGSTATDDLSDYLGDAKGQTLQEKLMSQLTVSDLDQKRYAIAEELIHSVDAQGYLTDYAEVSTLIQEKYNVAPRKVGEVLKIIQTFQPDGVGARSLNECLMIQLSAQQFEHEALALLFKTIINHHLENLALSDYETIAEDCHVDPDAVEHVHQYIQDHFDPEPGLAYHTKSDEKQVIRPSFELVVTDDDVTLINLERRHAPQVQLNTRYLAQLQDPQLDKESRAFLAQQHQRAKDVIECIENRYRILDQLGEYLARYQVDYFRFGSAYLKPLLQKDLALVLNVSASTVSRIVTSKYILAGTDTVLIKTLCPRAYFGRTIEQLKRVIQDLFRRFPDASDQKIVEKCRSLDLKIARRTITKYRHLSDIPARYIRKETQ